MQVTKPLHQPSAVGRLSARAWVVGTLLFVLAFIAVVTPKVIGDHAPWPRIAQPLIGETRDNPMIAYTEIMGGVAIQKENLPTFKGVVLLEGGHVQAEYYNTRVLYNYLAALIAPAIGLFPSLLILNLAGWGGTVLLSWHFASRLSGGSPFAAALSASLTATSIGWVVHVGDFSAHLMAGVAYFAGTVALHGSEIASRRRRLTVHLALGVAIALASLTYNTGIMLAGVYALAAFRHNRLWHIAVALIIGLSAQPLWTKVLEAIAGNPVASTDSEYLRRSLEAWFGQLAQEPVSFVAMGLRFAAEYVAVDSPPVVVLGLIALFLTPRLAGDRLLLVTAVLLPIAAVLPYRQVTVGSIAYSIFGIAPILHASLALALDRMKRKPACIGAGLLLLAQAVWSSGPAWGWMAPVLAYFYGPFGLNGGWTAFPEVISFTGNEPTPAFFGGSATLDQASLAHVPQDYIATGFNPFVALIAKALPTAYVVGLVLLLMRPGRTRRVVVGSFLALVVAASFLAAATRPVPPPKTVNVWSTFRHPSGVGMVYRITPGKQVVEKMSRLPADAAVNLYLGVANGKYEVLVRMGGRIVPVRETVVLPDWGCRLVLDEAALRAGLGAGGDLEVVVTPHSPLTVRGWQRADLAGRSMSPEGAVLPLVELHARDRDGALLWATF